MGFLEDTTLVYEGSSWDEAASAVAGALEKALPGSVYGSTQRSLTQSVHDLNNFSFSSRYGELTSAVKAFVSGALSVESLYGVMNLVSQKYNASRWDLFFDVQESLNRSGAATASLSEHVFGAGVISSSIAKNFMRHISSDKVDYQWEKLPDEALDNPSAKV